MSTPRVVLFGPMGIGKTTAIRTLCGDGAVDCDVVNLDTASHDKATTTVGADFGIVHLDGGEMLHVYGSPGQDRFGFLRQWLLSFAVGAMVLVDPHAPDALADTARTLREVRETAPGVACVVLVARPTSTDAMGRLAEALARELGQAIPVMSVDVRDRAQMLDALDLLVAVLPDEEVDA
ncbi:MAG: GTPase [Proteobacteria bacterium]|nr:GTPase [Pseudomonadota bacterium]